MSTVKEQRHMDTALGFPNPGHCAQTWVSGFGNTKSGFQVYVIPTIKTIKKCLNFQLSGSYYTFSCCQVEKLCL